MGNQCQTTQVGKVDWIADSTKRDQVQEENTETFSSLSDQAQRLEEEMRDFAELLDLIKKENERDYFQILEKRRDWEWHEIIMEPERELERDLTQRLEEEMRDFAELLDLIKKENERELKWFSLPNRVSIRENHRKILEKIRELEREEERKRRELEREDDCERSAEDLREFKRGLKPETKKFVAKRNTEKITVGKSPALPLFEEYQMNRFPRGKCIIFDNQTFTYDLNDPSDRGAIQLDDRPGSSLDRDMAEDTFTDLGFTVRIHNNLTAKEMVKTLTEYSEEDHSQYDCFVCVILSHGMKDHILGSDGKPVPMRGLTYLFKNQSCPGLCGKPKLFFIQACQVQEKQFDQVKVDLSGGEVIPDEPDFLIGVSTVPKCVSYPKTGSVYIQILCKALQEYSNQYHILNILTYVNREVGKLNADIESPGPLFTLRKQLFFRPLSRV